MSDRTDCRQAQSRHGARLRALKCTVAAEPSRAEPSRAEPSRAEPSRAVASIVCCALPKPHFPRCLRVVCRRACVAFFSVAAAFFTRSFAIGVASSHSKSRRSAAAQRHGTAYTADHTAAPGAAPHSCMHARQPAAIASSGAARRRSACDRISGDRPLHARQSGIGRWQGGTGPWQGGTGPWQGGTEPWQGGARPLDARQGGVVFEARADEDRRKQRGLCGRRRDSAGHVRRTAKRLVTERRHAARKSTGEEAPQISERARGSTRSGDACSHEYSHGEI